MKNTLKQIMLRSPDFELLIEIKSNFNIDALNDLRKF